jgi:uncharacterized protein YyaL (SSP411 family)
MTSGDKLLHRYRDGNKAVNGHADDYSFVIYGLLNLYESTYNPNYLHDAINFNDFFTSKFWDKNQKGFYFTSEQETETFLRTKEFYDGAIPSSNSVEFMNLQLLSNLTANPIYEDYSFDLAKGYGSFLKDSPTGASFFLSGLDFYIGPTSQIVIVGDLNDEKTGEMFKMLDSNYLPRKVVLFIPHNKSRKAIDTIVPFAKSHTELNGLPTAYVCKNFNCNLPTNNPHQMIK